MIILGLTGSIGMGKSTVAAQFRQLGAQVVDADALVHQLLSPRGAAFDSVVAQFPQAVENGQINRQVLGKIVFAEDEKLKQLEQIIHPLARQQVIEAVRRARYRQRGLLVLEIPLLFETHMDEFCDGVVVATAPAFIQRRRVLRRKGMTPEKFTQILQHQLPDAEKRKRADMVIHTSLGKAASMQQIARLIRRFN